MESFKREFLSKYGCSEEVFNGLLKRAQSKSIEKAALEAGKTGRHHVILPVGSVKEPGAGGTQEAGKIKTMDPQTGKTKWKSIRAGVVMAEDGTPQSSRLV